MSWEPTERVEWVLEEPRKMQNEKVSILRDFHCGPVAKTSLFLSKGVRFHMLQLEFTCFN